jgi:hypothetical protein
VRHLIIVKPPRLPVELLYSLAVATVFLLLTSTCSPLYAFNDWVDANSFMTMGKGLLRGLVPYRDLFEQKGPLLYFLHALAYLVDRTSFGGVFIFEIMAMTVTLFLAGRTMRLFVPVLYTWFALPVFACLTLVSGSFDGGDSAEEFCLPLIMGLFTIMARYFKENPQRPLSSRQALAVGIMAGCVLMIKYTMLASWLAFAVILLTGAIARKQIRELAICIGAFLGGMVLAVLPWIIYFGVNQALGDFYQTYFLINITLYAQPMTMMERIRQIGIAIGTGFGNNWISGLITLYGLVRFAASSRFFPAAGDRLALPLCMSFQILATYFSGRNYVYYYLTFLPFLVFGLIALADNLAAHRPLAQPSQRMLPALLPWWLILAVVTISASPNIPLMQKSRSDYPQIAFAAIINQVPDAAVLNYGFLDGGFYTAADVTPPFKYFMLNNIDFTVMPEMLDEMNRYIQDREADFVILRLNKGDDASQAGTVALREYYQLVAEKTMAYRGSGLIFKYALYQLRPDSGSG